MISRSNEAAETAERELRRLIRALADGDHPLREALADEAEGCLGVLLAEWARALRALADPFAHGEPPNWNMPDMEIDCCVKITYEDVLLARALLEGRGWERRDG